MVSFTSLALLGLTAVGSLAAPAEKRWSGDCMTAAEAQQVADNYAELIRHYSDELAIDALAADFTDYSESVNTLINTCPQGKAAKAESVPLLAASFTNRNAFMVGQGQQPAINFKQLNIESNCNFVTIRWMTTNTAPIPNPRPVVGIILLQTEKALAGSKYPWIINTVYSEFDSGAWLQNLEQWGICTVTASGSPQLPLPSGTVGAPPPASASSAPASASGYASASSSYASAWSSSSSVPSSSWSSQAYPAASSSSSWSSQAYPAASSSSIASYSNGQYSWSSSSSVPSATASAVAYSSAAASTASAYTA